MFAGLLSKERPVSDWGDIDGILAALAPYGENLPRDCWVSERHALLQVSTQQVLQSSGIYQHPDSGVAVVLWGRLDNRSELQAMLGIESSLSQEQLIAHAWLKWGENCPEKLIGDFAFAVASPRTGAVFLARDVMGVKPLYYRQDENGIFFANSAAAFKPLKLGKLTLRREWLAAYLIDMSWSHDKTAFDEINKLPRAHSILIQADGRHNLRRYHQFVDDAPIERARDPRWLDAYKSVWQEAVKCRTPESGRIGCENSGGLDSGSITAEVARLMGSESSRLYGMGFCREILEPEFIMATAMKYKLKHNALFSHESIGEWPHISQHECRVNGYPQEHGNGSYHYPFYQLCRQNDIGVLFSGFGGDEVVTNPSTKQVRLELADQHSWKALLAVMPGRYPVKLARFAKNVYLAHAEMPVSNDWLLNIWKARWPYQFLRQEVLDNYGLEAAYYATATYDETFRKINEAAIYLINRPFAPTRLENCSLMAASFGVEYVWPLLDQRLVQQWLSTPAVWKVGDGGTGRYLHRRAVEDVCHGKVAWKPNKDMGYVEVQKHMDAFDNRPTLNKLLAEIEGLHGTLLDLVDTARLQEMAIRGIKEDWRGSETKFALDENLLRLQTLNNWLKSTC